MLESFLINLTVLQSLQTCLCRVHLVLIDIDPSPCAKVHRDEASEVEKLSHSLLAARMTDPVHTIDKPAIYLMANDRILIKSAALRK